MIENGEKKGVKDLTRNPAEKQNYQTFSVGKNSLWKNNILSNI